VTPGWFDEEGDRPHMARTIPSCWLGPTPGIVLDAYRARRWACAEPSRSRFAGCCEADAGLDRWHDWLRVGRAALRHAPSREVLKRQSGQALNRQIGELLMLSRSPLNPDGRSGRQYSARADCV